MIERYTRPQMGNLWTLENRYRCWLQVELAACRAMNELGMIPDADLAVILEKADFNVDRVAQIEEVTRHDVIAFLSNVAEYVGEPSHWIHFGMTSSDVLDTGLALQMKQSAELMLTDMRELSTVLARRALEFCDLPCIGRSHGIHAEPTVFGLKFALWYDELNRDIERMERAQKAVSVGMISGAVGNFAYLTPDVEERACAHLGLVPANISTQVIQRDAHAEFLSAMAITATTIEKIALEIRHWQRTEVHEAEEGFGKGQKGSSAMPHKKNPILSEQLCGLARILRGNLMAALENNALWHERDISHSSVERVILPDSCILVDYMLTKTTGLIEKLRVLPENIARNLDLTHGLVYSQAVLLSLAGKGVLRDDAYRMVQRNALSCWEAGRPFRELLEADSDIMAVLTKADLDTAFSPERFTAQADFILKRVGILS
jgi:adenylosuccinate lyase